MSFLTHFDLFAAGITVAATLVLGYSVYYSNTASITNRMFFWFSLATACWGVDNYLSYQFADPNLTLLLLRGILFFAILQSFFLYEFFLVFPETRYQFSHWHNYLFMPVVFALAILALSPYGFVGLAGPVNAGQIALAVKGPVFWACAGLALLLSVVGLLRFFRTYLRMEGEMRHATTVVMTGAAITVGLVVFFDLIVAMVFGDPEFIPFGAFFMIPLVASVAYAILGKHLLDIKVAATSIFVFVLATATFGEVVVANSTGLLIFRVAVFVLVLVYGVNLIRTMLREVEQRAKIEQLANELTETNKRQETLVHFISHEVKGYLAKDAATFAALAEGDMGALTEDAKKLVLGALAQTREGVESVTDILKAANQKKGTIEYKKEPFDLAELVTAVVEKEKPAAGAKHLALSIYLEQKGPFQIMGDRAEIGEHVLRNLIENAINYTPSGSIVVSLRRKHGSIVLEVKDTGVGISEVDRARLFTEGGHGKDSQKINAHSTGFGLYIAKNIVTAHGGTIRAESEGPGKGSTFVVEFPA